MKSVWWVVIGIFLHAAAGCDEAETTKKIPKETPKGCVEGYDADNPSLRVSAFVPTNPDPFAALAMGAQNAIDSEATIYLFTLSDISGDGTVSGRLGIGEAADDEGRYRFNGDAESMRFEISGKDFTSKGDAAIDLLIPLINGDQLRTSIHETVFEGTFKNKTHCTIGELVEEGPPSKWETAGTLKGKLTVAEAKATSIAIEQPIPTTFSLCAYFAYSLSSALSLQNDPNCEADPSTWTYPPDTTTADGADAWLISADIAATSVLIE